ncbi:MAG: hypothetical protein ACM3RX_05845 [Methanococcaceae archaeon]
MKKTLLVILLGHRKETAVNVQKVLTGWGCLIKTRLGIHDGVLDNCSNTGLIILELVGKQEDREELARKISLISDVTYQMVELEVPTDETQP